jgi:hypothetical protein
MDLQGNFLLPIFFNYFNTLQTLILTFAHLHICFIYLPNCPGSPATKLLGLCPCQTIGGCRCYQTIGALPATKLSGLCPCQTIADCRCYQTVGALPLSNYRAAATNRGSALVKLSWAPLLPNCRGSAPVKLLGL